MNILLIMSLFMFNQKISLTKLNNIYILHRKMNLGDNVYPKDPFTLLNFQSLLVIEIFAAQKI